MSSTIAFFGASGGCGLAALRRAVDAGHTCIALCRTPSKLESEFPSKPANLIIKAGDAHDQVAVSACLTHPSNASQLVDVINFSIGGTLNMSNMTIPDPDVCKKGMVTVLQSLKDLRANGCAGSPLLSVISTTGISKYGRDVPLAFLPMYHYMLKQPHEDKKAMEEEIVKSEERFVMVRPSFLTAGPAKPEKALQVGIEDPKKGIEKKAVGYTISKEDVGRWMFEEVLLKHKWNQYEGKAVSISY